MKERSLTQQIAGVAGNVLEWYDFAVFGFFGDIIGEVFFPPQEGHAAMVESFAVFGGAFLMRPVGGVMLGYIGDKYGRKRALELSIFLMAFPTFTMGCLPGYDSVGWVSILLLAITRMLQGMSVGGQLMSSAVFTVEAAPRHKWGQAGSYVMASANFGTLLGGLVAYALRESLTEEQLKSWGWRVPFWSGIIVAVFGIYIKYYVEEESHLSSASEISPSESESAPTAQSTGGDLPQDSSLDVVEARKALPPLPASAPNNNRRASGDNKFNPIHDALFVNGINTLCCALVPMLWCCGFYLGFVWLAVFMVDLVDPPIENGFFINSWSLLIGVCLTFPVGGILSDMYGLKRVMTIGGLGLMLWAPIAIYVISAGGNSWGSFFAQVSMGLIMSLYGSPMLTLMMESFPPESRLTSISIGYNISQALIGGMTPSVATLLVDKVGLASPGFYLSIICWLSLIGLWLMPEGQWSAQGAGYNSRGGGERRASDTRGLLNGEEVGGLEMSRLSSSEERPASDSIASI